MCDKLVADCHNALIPTSEMKAIAQGIATAVEIAEIHVKAQPTDCARTRVHPAAETKAVKREIEIYRLTIAEGRTARSMKGPAVEIDGELVSWEEIQAASAVLLESLKLQQILDGMLEQLEASNAAIAKAQAVFRNRERWREGEL